MNSLKNVIVVLFKNISSRNMNEMMDYALTVPTTNLAEQLLGMREMLDYSGKTEHINKI